MSRPDKAKALAFEQGAILSRLGGPAHEVDGCNAEEGANGDELLPGAADSALRTLFNTKGATMTNSSARSAVHASFPLALSTRDTPSWAATGRYGIRPAPGGLALVQDFLNTRASALTGVDMLCDVANADAWAAQAVRAWSMQRETQSQQPTLTAHDADKLRDLRDALDNTLAGVPSTSALYDLGAVKLAISGIGELLWTPAGHGWRWCYGAIIGEVLLSRHSGTWHRLKRCRNAACRATFYDSAWHNGTVWHNRNTCDPAVRDRVTPSVEAASNRTILHQPRVG
jgi:hypothetical protein